MINTYKLEPPLSRTYFHGPIGVRAIEVLMYILYLPCVSLLHKNAGHGEEDVLLYFNYSEAFPFGRFDRTFNYH